MNNFSFRADPRVKIFLSDCTYSDQSRRGPSWFNLSAEYLDRTTLRWYHVTALFISSIHLVWIVRGNYRKWMFPLSILPTDDDLPSLHAHGHHKSSIYHLQCRTPALTNIRNWKKCRHDIDDFINLKMLIYFQSGWIMVFKFSTI